MIYTFSFLTAIALGYLFSKGMTSDLELRLTRKEKELEGTRQEVLYYKNIIQNDRRVLINTINELRNELNKRN